MRHTIETYSGKYFDYDDPRPEHISAYDIARALSNICRFGGHTDRFWSVASHAVLVSWVVEEEMKAGPELAYAALHHDSHEAYIGDVVTPLKQMLGDVYRDLRCRVDAAIGTALGVDPSLFEHPIVKQADELALRLEAAKLKRSRGVGAHWGNYETYDPRDYDIHGEEPEKAEGIFQRTHTRLYLQGGAK